MSEKVVKYLMPAHTVDMGGFPVKQPLPTQQVAQVDSFLLLHHAKVKPLRDRPAKTQGVGPHPHRGFSPVTFVVQGAVHHRDSHYNNQVAEAGEVQWMHAGAGVVHSERPTEALVEAHSYQEIIQLWINTPAAKKMNPPQYLHIGQDRMVEFKSNDRSVLTRLVAGEYGEQTVNNEIVQSPLFILWMHGLQSGKEQVVIPKSYNGVIYVIKGQIRIEGYGIVDKEHLIVLEDEMTSVNVHFNPDAQCLVLSGAPLNEKVVQHGPFVMNSETEILEAMRDYQMGKMGVLIED